MRPSTSRLVIDREDYRQAKVDLEKRSNRIYFDHTNYDGDAWEVVAYLLDKQADYIKELEDDITEYSEAQPPI